MTDINPFIYYFNQCGDHARPGIQLKPLLGPHHYPLDSSHIIQVLDLIKRNYIPRMPFSSTCKIINYVLT